MRSDKVGTGAHFWWQWASGCFLGWFLGFFLGFVLAGSLEGLIGNGPAQSMLAYTLIGVFVGAGVGLMQWRLLRRQLSKALRWIGASAAGMGMAGGAGYGVAVLIFGYSEGLEDIDSASAVLGWSLVAAWGGVIAGLIQRHALSGRGRDADHWAVASTFGWSLSFAAFGAVGAMLLRAGQGTPALGAAAFFLALLAGGVVLGVLTAIPASRLFRGSQAGSAGGAAQA